MFFFLVPFLLFRFQEKKKLRQQQQAEREAQRNKYRDRAKELRDGKNMDYAVIILLVFFLKALPFALL